MTSPMTSLTTSATSIATVPLTTTSQPMTSPVNMSLAVTDKAPDVMANFTG